MKVYGGAAPAGIDVVTVARGPGTLVVLVPCGMRQTVVLDQLVAQLDVAERDSVRMALGRPPVGATTGPTWSELDELRWSPEVLPEELRLPGAQVCARRPLPLPTRLDVARSRARRARLELQLHATALIGGGFFDGLGAMGGRRAAACVIALALVVTTRAGLELPVEAGDAILVS